jgi:hypothetical protein
MIDRDFGVAKGAPPLPEYRERGQEAHPPLAP